MSSIGPVERSLPIQSNLSIQPVRMKSLSPEFVSRYFKTTALGKIVTPNGLQILVDVERKKGKLKTDCIPCSTHDQLKNELRQIMSANEPVTKAFLVKSPDPHDHITPVYVQKKDGEFRVLLMDTQGGEAHYDTSTLYDLASLNIPNLKVYNLVEKRQWDTYTCPIFSLSDVITMSNIENIFEYFAVKTQDRPVTRIQALFPPRVDFKPLYLQDLPPPFLELTTHHRTFEKYLTQHPDVEVAEKLREAVRPHLVEKIVKGNIIQSNMWAHQRNDESMATIEAILMKEQYIKTTPDGKVITPAGLNIIIDVLKRDGQLTIDCVACDDHQQLKDGLQEIIHSQKDVTKAFLVKSVPPFDHITPVYVQKNKSGVQVILMDTQGGEKYYDFTPMLTLQSLNIPHLTVYHLVEKREWDKTNASIFALYDILTIGKYDNFFQYLEGLAGPRQTQILWNSNETYKPTLPFKPIYLADLPLEFIKFTTDLKTLENNLKERNPQETQSLKERVTSATGDIRYGQQTVKANLLVFQYFEQYASLLERILV